jgi:hypothetical protein
MRNTSSTSRFWFKAGLGLSLATLPWSTVMGLGTTTIAVLLSSAVQAATLSNWEFDPSTQQLAVTVPGGTTPRYFLAAEPARIVLDLPNTSVGTVPLAQSYGGPVRDVRVAQFSPDVTRIVLELAPGTVLAPGHVELQQVDAGTEQGDRWVLRPLLAGDSAVAAADVPAGNMSAEPPLEPNATAIPVEPPPEMAAALPTPEAIVAPTASPAVSVPPPTVAVPTAAPDEAAAEIQSESDQATERNHAQQGSGDGSDLVRLPGPTADAVSPAPERSAPPSPSIEPSLPQPSQPLAQSAPEAPLQFPTPTTPGEFPTDPLTTTPGGATVTVPPLNAAPTNEPSDAATDQAPDASETAERDQMDEADAPPAASAPIAPSPAAPAPVTPAPTAAGSVLEFGQPLPQMTRANTPTSSQVILPSGTVLNARYTGETPLELAEGESRQEVLVLAETVHDEVGNVVFPEGSFVIGRFEKRDDDSHFIAQAISLQGQSILVNAQSEQNSRGGLLNGNLLRNSALGIAAGAVLGVTGIGLIPAIAAGAATTAASSFLLPSGGSSNVIQPDQVLEVRLTQDLVRAN